MEYDGPKGLFMDTPLLAAITDKIKGLWTLHWCRSTLYYTQAISDSTLLIRLGMITQGVSYICNHPQLSWSYQTPRKGRNFGLWYTTHSQKTMTSPKNSTENFTTESNWKHIELLTTTQHPWLNCQKKKKWEGVRQTKGSENVYSDTMPRNCPLLGETWISRYKDCL